MKPLAILLLAGAAAAAFAADPPPAAAEKDAAPVSDRDLSLYKGSLTEVVHPGPVAWNRSSPGELPRRSPAFAGAPPPIPHGVEETEPVSRGDHPCLACHSPESVDGVGEGDPPPVPASHRTDLRRSPEKAGDDLAGARWDCRLCHVSLSGTEPARANRFRSP